MRKGNFGGKVMMLPETAAEVEEMGWETYDSRWTKGYISRKSKPVDWPICTAGGSRRGALFYRHPSWGSQRITVTGPISGPENRHSQSRLRRK